MRAIIMWLCVSLTSITYTSLATAALLEKADPEYKQLIAMGYTLTDLNDCTLAKLGDYSRLCIAKTKDNNRISLARYMLIDEKKWKNAEKKAKFMTAVNQFNIERFFQLSVVNNNEGSFLLICLSNKGSYDAQVFGSLIYEILQANLLLSTLYPDIWDVLA